MRCAFRNVGVMGIDRCGLAILKKCLHHADRVALPLLSWMVEQVCGFFEFTNSLSCTSFNRIHPDSGHRVVGLVDDRPVWQLSHAIHRGDADRPCSIRCSTGVYFSLFHAFGFLFSLFSSPSGKSPSRPIARGRSPSMRHARGREIDPSHRVGLQRSDRHRVRNFRGYLDSRCHHW
jgi:hypothetical protein